MTFGSRAWRQALNCAVGFAYDLLKRLGFQERYQAEPEDKAVPGELLKLIRHRKGVSLLFGAKDTAHHNASTLQAVSSEVQAMHDNDSRHPAGDTLPPSWEPYRSTPVFTEATVPPGLLRSHRTASGTWALIRVLEGQLLYRVLDPPSERLLNPSVAPGLAEPGVPHEVALLGPVRFQVVFHRLAGLDVQSQGLMVHSSPASGRRHYGPSSSWLRQHDSGSPSSDTA